MDKIFMKKENRDKLWKSLPKNIKAKHRRTNIRNQLLHPMYIEDYFRELTNKEKGFGNTLYKTYFDVLYQIVEKY